MNTLGKSVNILSFDVEDGYQGFIRRGISGWENLSSSEEDNIKMILELLSANSVTATFFVLAGYAEKNPGVVKIIHEAGHEIASHGYSHKVIPALTPDEFRSDIIKSRNILSDLIGEAVVGFRAPKWSAGQNTKWMFPILAEEGFKYDSSIFPSSFHEFGSSRYRCAPFRIKTEEFSLLEFPAQIYKLGPLRIPAAGGFYFRLLPLFFSGRAIRITNKKYNYGMVYLHPFEFDVDSPVLKSGLLFKIVRYHNLKKTFPYLSKLMKDFQFTNIQNVLADPSREYPEIAF